MNIGYLRGALQGIASYAREKKGWLLDHRAPTAAGMAAILEQQPDGVILGTLDSAIFEWVSKLRVPVINLGIFSPTVPLSHVGNDDVAIGEMGAAYFLAKGYRQFGFAAITGQRGDRRAAGFVQALERAGYGCSLLDHTSEGAAADLPGRGEPLAHWLKELPKPVAVLSSNDNQAWAITEQCARLGLRVPADVSVLGVDNDVTVCALSEPPLSSIQTGAESVGYEAARLLEAHVKSPPKEPIRLEIAPIRVVERESTDAFAIDDAIISAALRYMKSHLRSPLSMDAFAQQLACSRRKLERRFHEKIGQAPAQAWVQLRTNEARRLLAETDLSIEDISYVAGFNDVSQLSNAFRRHLGMTPTAFRKRARP